MIGYVGQNRDNSRVYLDSEIGQEDGSSSVSAEFKPKMKVEEQGGINWTWFKVQNGNLVAVFRLHYGEGELVAFRKLQRKLMIKVDKIDVPLATWREKCDLITSHTTKEGGYELPEVKEAFGWLNKMFRGTADNHELESCPEGTMRHLEYHGVAICRI